MGDDLPLVDLGTSEKAIAVAAGSFHSCALLDTGKLKCWGVYFMGILCARIFCVPFYLHLVLLYFFTLRFSI